MVAMQRLLLLSSNFNMTLKNEIWFDYCLLCFPLAEIYRYFYLQKIMVYIAKDSM